MRGRPAAGPAGTAPGRGRGPDPCPVPAEIQGLHLAADGVSLSWTADPDADAYNLSRADSGDLHSGGVGACHGFGLTTPDFTRTDVPEPGQTCYFVVTGESLAGGKGTQHREIFELLSWLADGLRSLQIALSGAAVNEPRGYPSIWDKTVICTMSEFGRTTITNGGNGPDHAAASCMLALGGPVNGAVYNCEPATWPAGVMIGVNNRDLLHRTDYRAICWEIQRDHMGAATPGLEAIFPGYTAQGLGSQELGLIPPGA